jgi:hypothetical protein
MAELFASIDKITRDAEEAADNNRGIGRNPYPDDSVAHVTWKQVYAARYAANSEQVAA